MSYVCTAECYSYVLSATSFYMSFLSAYPTPYPGGSEEQSPPKDTISRLGDSRYHDPE